MNRIIRVKDLLGLTKHFEQLHLQQQQHHRNSLASLVSNNNNCLILTREEHNFSQAGGIDHVMYPQYEHKSAADIMREKMQESIITIPTGLKKRLDKREIKNATKGAIKQRIIDASRQGRKSRVLISCKRHDLNHYHSQTYPRGETIPLASKGWGHRESARAHDQFTIQAYDSNFALKDLGPTFEDLNLSEHIIKVLEKNKLEKPTVIQAYAIRSLLNRNHCILASETGSGKTLAYLLPLFELLQLRKKKRNLPHGLNSPLMLILLPTRELADQVYEVAKHYGDDLGIKVKLLQGGNLGSKIASPPSEEKIDIIISTVNVITQLSKAGIYKLDHVQNIVLDEADTLLDDSFSPSVINLLRKFSFVVNDDFGGVQLTLVSATMPRSIHTILDGVFPVESFQKITTPGLHRVMPHVPQKFVRIKKSEKEAKAIEIARNCDAQKIPLMIFCNKSSTCAWLTFTLLGKNLSCIGIHGDLTPAQRAGRIEKYKSGEVNILVCTDIASRGIDTTNTQHVLNYDFPHFLADYIHRCGRTGRVGGTKQCKVTNFISRVCEIDLVQEIETSVRKQVSIENVNANIKRLLNVRLGHADYELHR